MHYPIGPECILHPSPEVHADDEAYSKRNANVEGIVQEATPFSKAECALIPVYSDLQLQDTLAQYPNLRGVGKVIGGGGHTWLRWSQSRTCGTMVTCRKSHAKQSSGILTNRSSKSVTRFPSEKAWSEWCWPDLHLLGKKAGTKSTTS